ncbi:LON peptidase substrate-binding domain-containing protein [Luteipulveratus sp. YIM 133132]|uniref:LON peptidase substrate-binding domain-containing protein n=1 Tax=Luteipulveratus flavus TaxID=3031728 RepID=A0ABT6CAU7_9MICO|nr:MULTISPECIES: LON peptidase substrate-binding domain-containing protein [unclassified Luteipulveratus]MDE9366387.1 LON peptidase substrate-binding domain-containing protein [Luteipulveratus sp. YIM 133132]MDF8266015.1 LON peptidase substrate-binding domain-containing protein [Luteipulveratus sp. YIM 133296]
MASLPLFPLSTALLPGERLPLQIFETRYLAMVRDLVQPEVEVPRFGVVAIREGNEVGTDRIRSLYDVGCTAVIRRAAVLADNRLLTVVEGADRFHLDALDDTATTPYATGLVRWLPDDDGDATTVAALADRLRAEITEMGGDEDDLPQEARALSWALPDLMDLDLADRQRLLERSSTEERLRHALYLLRRERELASTLHAAGRPRREPFNLN